ncbi:hypothetical protein Tco_0902682 [Tanacetum coccineum]
MALCDHFPRIYNLEQDKEVLVGNRGRWLDGSWEWCWDWSRPPRGRSAREFEAIEELLLNVNISHSRKDRWKWNVDDKGLFSVKVLSRYIEEHNMANRNNKVFKGRTDSSTKVFQDIQLKAFEWVSRRSKKWNLQWKKWMEIPFSCSYVLELVKKLVRLLFRIAGSHV